MGITDYIKTRLLNNRVEQYNTKRSYWGEDERQPRTDGINTGLDLPDALPPVINKTIANARYAVKLDGYTSGILKNRIDYSKDQYAKKVAMGKTAGAKRKVDDKQIYDLAREGKTATEIATILNISKSSVDHSDGWRSRKDNEFAF